MSKKPGVTFAECRAARIENDCSTWPKITACSSNSRECVARLTAHRGAKVARETVICVTKMRADSRRTERNRERGGEFRERAAAEDCRGGETEGVTEKN